MHTFLKPSNCIYSTTKCDRTEWTTATGSSLLLTPNDHVTITMLKSGLCVCVCVCVRARAWTYWTAFLSGFYVLHPQPQNTNAALITHLLRTFPAVEI